MENETEPGRAIPLEELEAHVKKYFPRLLLSTDATITEKLNRYSHYWNKTPASLRWQQDQWIKKSNIRKAELEEKQRPTYKLLEQILQELRAIKKSL